MTSPTGSVSDLLATGTGGSGTSTLDASTFIDPFSESNPFAEDTLSSTISPHLRTSQSLNFHEYYPQPSIASEGDDTTGSGNMYNSTSFHKSFSAMNLAGNTPYDATPSSLYGDTGDAYSSTPALETTPHEDQEDDATEGTGHRRWDSVNSNPRYDGNDEQSAPAVESNEGHYRPESTRSLGSTV